MTLVDGLRASICVMRLAGKLTVSIVAGAVLGASALTVLAFSVRAAPQTISLDDWSEVQVRCLNDLGYPATATGDNGIMANTMTEDQDIRYGAALADCEARYPVDPSDLAPLNRYEIGTLYDYWTGPLTACLEAAGQAVPEPPARSAFIDEYLRDQPSWSAYDSVGPTANHTWTEINAACPQQPPSFRDP